MPDAAGSVEWEALKKRRDAYVKKLNKNYITGWQKEGPVQFPHSSGQAGSSGMLVRVAQAEVTLSKFFPYPVPGVQVIEGAANGVAAELILVTSELPGRASVIPQGPPCNR